jgi:hypothetical protein
LFWECEWRTQSRDKNTYHDPFSLQVLDVDACWSCHDVLVVEQVLMLMTFEGYRGGVVL